VTLTNQDLTGTIEREIRESEMIAESLRRALVISGRVNSTVDLITAFPRALESLATNIAEVAKALLPALVVDQSGHLVEIRRFFLSPEPAYSLDRLAELFQVSIDDMIDVYHDEIVRQIGENVSEIDNTAVSSVRIEWADAVRASRTFNLLRPWDIDLALGEHFNRVQPDAWRTVPVLVRLPRFIVDTIVATPAGLRTLDFAVHIENLILELYQNEYNAVLFRNQNSGSTR
jgi:hypothetical protein